MTNMGPIYDYKIPDLKVVLKFLMDYPLGTKLRQHIEFYVLQLEYEHETGRESTLEMLANMFQAFPQV